MSLVPAIVAGICFAWLANKRLTPATALAPAWLDLASHPQWCQATAMTALGVIVLGIVVIVFGLACRVRPTFSGLDLVGWACGAATTGAAIWLGVYLYTTARPPVAIDPQLLLGMLGTP